MYGDSEKWKVPCSLPLLLGHVSIAELEIALGFHSYSTLRSAGNALVEQNSHNHCQLGTHGLV